MSSGPCRAIALSRRRGGVAHDPAVPLSTLMTASVPSLPRDRTLRTEGGLTSQWWKVPYDKHSRSFIPFGLPLVTLFLVPPLLHRHPTPS